MARPTELPVARLTSKDTGHMGPWSLRWSSGRAGTLQFPRRRLSPATLTARPALSRARTGRADVAPQSAEVANQIAGMQSAGRLASSAADWIRLAALKSTPELHIDLGRRLSFAPFPLCIRPNGAALKRARDWHSVKGKS